MFSCIWVSSAVVAAPEVCLRVFARLILSIDRGRCPYSALERVIGRPLFAVSPVPFWGLSVMSPRAFHFPLGITSRHPSGLTLPSIAGVGPTGCCFGVSLKYFGLRSILCLALVFSFCRIEQFLLHARCSPLHTTHLGLLPAFST